MEGEIVGYIKRYVDRKERKAIPSEVIEELMNKFGVPIETSQVVITGGYYIHFKSNDGRVRGSILYNKVRGVITHIEVEYVEMKGDTNECYRDRECVRERRRRKCGCVCGKVE